MSDEKNLLGFILNEFAKGTSVEELNKLGDSYTFTRSDLLEIIKNLEVVAYAKTNDRGDLFDLRTQNNPYNDQSKVVPLYVLKGFSNAQ